MFSDVSCGLLAEPMFNTLSVTGALYCFAPSVADGIRVLDIDDLVLAS